MSEDDEGRKHLPVWPHPRFAEACAAGPWARAQPESIDVDEWVIGWSENLERDGLTVVVFQTPDDEGVSASPARVKADLSRELARFGP